MSELVANCPRCSADRITFDLLSENLTHLEYSWQRWYEVFCICRNCERSTIFVLSQRDYRDSSFFEKNKLSLIKTSLNTYFEVESFISIKDLLKVRPSDFLPDDIKRIFDEGSACLSIQCFNAAATMFRLCVDLATVDLLPDTDVHGLNSKIRRDLGLRLPWLFENKLLDTGLAELSSCIKDDGNDGAHRGDLKSEDAEDLIDFTLVLLERRFTEPERLRLAKERREVRRKK